MKQFQYTVEYMKNELKSKHLEETSLEGFGKEGWELVSVVKDDKWTIYYFKKGLSNEEV